MGPESVMVAAVERNLQENDAQSDPPRREYQELWLALARKSWRSLALVAEREESASEITSALAEVARMLDERVSFFAPIDVLDYVSVAGIFSAANANFAADIPRPVKAPVRSIAILPPVVRNPLALKVATAADVVVICVEIGKTRLSAVRRTIELIGRDHVAGCVLIG
ncbi:MAG TPA: hypothetical protein VK648_00955 [Gemmatimonadaceae bacterium]|nr:hypothetical protein [Gemmatimonadaceae bacterium]